MVIWECCGHQGVNFSFITNASRDFSSEMTGLLNTNILFFFSFSSKLQDGLRHQLKFSFKAQMKLIITSNLLNSVFVLFFNLNCPHF